MADRASCPKCGHELPVNAPAGLCPGCLLLGALVSEETDPPPSTTFAGSSPHRPSGSVAAEVIAGRYTLLEVLGEGGMGTVYRAGQAAPVKRQVALKLIKIGMDSRAVLARFNAERQALAMMDHPNIARIYDGGVTTAGQPFFVMELVRGVPLTEYCDAQRLTVRARLELFVSVCQAVQHAHQKGIIHRDLKPSNVLVTEVDGRPTPKVIDFGVAKATEVKLTDMSFVDTGAIVGTPAYMSPEQADPRSMDIDTRTDVYALGVMLYELLTGSPPIDPKQFKRGAILEMLRMVREVDPPPPSTKLTTAEDLPNIAANRSIDPAQLRRVVRGDLDWVVMKALEKDRARRYDAANGFAADILRHLAHEPVLAAPPSRAYRTRKFLRKHRAGVIAASLVLLALLGGIVGTSIGMLQAREAREAETKRAEGEKRAKESETVERTKAEKAREKAQEQEQIALDKAEQLEREDYVSRVNRAYREVQDDNVALAEDLLHGCDPKRRGWEWHFVERLCNSERGILDLGNTCANGLAFSPDGTWAVAGAGSQKFGYRTEVEPTVDVWNVNTGQRLKTLPGAKGVVSEVAVSPDAKKAAAGCSAGLVVVWDVATGTIAWTRSEPGLDAMSVAFSPDGKSLAVGYGGFSGPQVGRVKVWDVASGKGIKAFPGPRGGVNKVAFHPDGKRLAMAGSEVVEVWDLENVRRLQELKGHKRWVYCLAYSPDGKWLATGGWDSTVKLRDATAGLEALTIFAHEGFVLSLAFSPDSRSLVTASDDHSARLWEVPSGRRLAAFHGHTDFVEAVAFRPQSREIGTASVDGSIRFWDLMTSRPVVIEHSGWVERIAFRRDGLRVLSEAVHYRTDTMATKGWNPFTGELDAALAGTMFDALPAEFVPGSGFLQHAATSLDGKLVAQIDEQGGSGGASRSKEYSLSAVTVRETTSGRLIHTLVGHAMDVVSLAFSPDGRRLATASFDRTVKLWDTQTGQDVFTLRGHTTGVVSLAFSPDGKQLCSGGIDNTARVWNATPLPSQVIAAHDARYRKKIDALSLLENKASAKFLAASGQWGMAAEALAQAAARDPDNLQLRYQQIDALGKAGNTGAIEAARKSIQTSLEAKLAKDSKDTAAAAALAHLYHLLGDQPALDRLLERHPAAVAGIGDRHAADMNWERAIAEYTKAITPQTKDVKLLAKRAEAYEKRKQWDLAVADWTRASQLQPDIAFQRFKPAGPGSWDLVTQQGAAGSMEEVDGTLVLATTVATGTPWHVQANQYQLQLENGAEYVIRFKMKSPDSHIVHIGAGINGGDYHSIGLNARIVPPSEFKDYEFRFVAHDVAPGNNRIGFELGMNRGTVMVKEIVILKLLERHPAAAVGDQYAAEKNWERAIAEYTKAITPQTKDAQLLARRAEAYEKRKQWDLAVADWTRASQLQPDIAFQRFKPAVAESWEFTARYGAAGSMEDVDGTLVLTTTAVTGTPWDVSANQNQLRLENGAEYVIRFKMKSPDSHIVQIAANSNGGDYHSIGLNEQIVPPPEFKDYEFKFVAHDIVDPGNNKIGFDLGTNRGTVMVKEIVILKKSALDKPLERHPAAAAGDQYAAENNWERAIAEYTKAITPQTKDARLLAKRAEAYEKRKQWDLAVADWTRASQLQPDIAFQRFKPAGAGSWGLVTQQGAAGSMEDVDGTLVLATTVATGTPWHVQANQYQLRLENGAEYVIRFKMKSPDSHIVRLIGCIIGGDYHSIGLNEQIVPPPAFKDYEFKFVAHDVAPGNNMIGFNLGMNRGKVMVKEIVILKK